MRIFMMIQDGNWQKAPFLRNHGGNFYWVKKRISALKTPIFLIFKEITCQTKKLNCSENEDENVVQH